MFVYLLILAELGVLYTVFWYLYLRDAKVNHRISAQMWGSYYEPRETQQLDPTLPFVRCCDEHDIYADAYTPREYILDHKTNSYVPLNNGSGLLNRMASTLDKTFSQLNVRP